MKDCWAQSQPDYDIAHATYPQPAPWPSAPESELLPVPELASHYIKPKKRWLLPVVAFVCASALLGMGAWLITLHRNDPSVIFNQALATSLHTQQVKQFWSDGTGSVIVAADLSDSKNLRTETIITKLLGADARIKGYGTLKNTYLTYASNPSEPSTTPAQLLDRWIAVRQGGKLPTELNGNLAATAADPRFQLLGPWIYSNFSKPDRSELLDFIKTSHLYVFDAQKVTHTTLAGQAVLTYNITINLNKLSEYNYRVAEMFGIPASDATIALNTYKNIQHVKLYIHKASRQVVRVESKDYDTTTIIDYTNHNDLKLSAEPHPSLSYHEYFEQLGTN